VAAFSGLLALDFKGKNNGGARARLEKRLSEDPNNPAVLMVAARTYMALGDGPGVERSLRHLIEVNPDQMDAYFMLGQVYTSQQRLDEARAEFEKLAEKRPKSAIAANTLIGIILQVQNKPKEAQARYEKVLAQDPRAPVAANNLAWMYAENGGNLDVALQLAQTAKAQLPDRHEVDDTLGWVYYKKGLGALAVQAFQDSVTKAPENAVYHYHLGLAYAQAGNKEEARKAIEQSLAIDPKFNGAQDAQRVLKGMKG
jgi:tetratricopeptide (TPR) repeat protein